MVEMISLVTLIAVVMLGLILWYFNSKQANALKAMARTAKDAYLMFLKARRETRKQQPLNLNAIDWFASQIGPEVQLVEVLSTSKNPVWVNVRAAGGIRLVVSPLDLDELRDILKQTEKKSRISSAYEPLLGDSRSLQVIERSIENEEWFDLDADQVGKQIGVNWGEVNRLWFYLVTPKAK